MTTRVCGDLATSRMGGSRLMDVVSPYEGSTKLQDQLRAHHHHRVSKAGNFKACSGSYRNWRLLLPGTGASSQSCTPGSSATGMGGSRVRHSGAATAFPHTLCIPLLPHSASASCRGCAKPHTLLLLLLLKISTTEA